MSLKSHIPASADLAALGEGRLGAVSSVFSSIFCSVGSVVLDVGIGKTLLNGYEQRLTA